MILVVFFPVLMMMMGVGCIVCFVISISCVVVVVVGGGVVDFGVVAFPV